MKMSSTDNNCFYQALAVAGVLPSWMTPQQIREWTRTQGMTTPADGEMVELEHVESVASKMGIGLDVIVVPDVEHKDKEPTVVHVTDSRPLIKMYLVNKHYVCHPESVCPFKMRRPQLKCQLPTNIKDMKGDKGPAKPKEVKLELKDVEELFEQNRKLMECVKDLKRELEGAHKVIEVLTRSNTLLNERLEGSALRKPRRPPPQEEERTIYRQPGARAYTPRRWPSAERNPDWRKPATRMYWDAPAGNPERVSRTYAKPQRANRRRSSRRASVVRWE